MIDPWTIFWIVAGLIVLWACRGVIALALLALLGATCTIGAGICAGVVIGFAWAWDEVSDWRRNRKNRKKKK